jgi:hypothetical protein
MLKFLLLLFNVLMEEMEKFLSFLLFGSKEKQYLCALQKRRRSKEGWKGRKKIFFAKYCREGKRLYLCSPKTGESSLRKMRGSVAGL